MKKLSRKEVQEIVQRYFENERIEPSQVKKMKTLAMSHNLRLKEYRKKFCKKCYVDLSLGNVRINNGKKQVVCGVCGTTNRWIIKD